MDLITIIAILFKTIHLTMHKTYPPVYGLFTITRILPEDGSPIIIIIFLTILKTQYCVNTHITCIKYCVQIIDNDLSKNMIIFLNCFSKPTNT